MASLKVMLSAPEGLAFCTYLLQRETAAKSAAARKALPAF